MSPVHPTSTSVSVASAQARGAAPPHCPPHGPPAAPEFLQRPVVGGPVLLVLDFHGHDGSGERASLSVFGGLWGQQVRRQWGVQCVRKEDKLELDL